MIEINKDPSAGMLRVFAGAWLVVLGLLGAIVLHKGGGLPWAGGLWAVGAVVGLMGLVWPRSILWVYLGLSYATFPIGWTISYLLMLAIYLAVFTPTGLLMRLAGRDPMCRRFDRSAQSYWLPRKAPDGTERYFRQF